MTQIIIPMTEIVDISTLSVDQKNPNRMTKEQHERLATSIKKWGFIVPIITNKDLLIADGEQRWTVAKSLGMSQVLVIRLPVEEVDRRLLRQVLNKLRGGHELLLDAEEFEAIIDLGHKDDLKYLLDLSDNDIDKPEMRPPNELEPAKVQKQARLQKDLSLGLITDDEYHWEMYNRPKPSSAPELSGTGFLEKQTETSGEANATTNTPQKDQPNSRQRAQTKKADASANSNSVS